MEEVAAAVERRWGFLNAWWQQLKWVNYHGLYGVDNVWNAHKRRLFVSISRWHYSFDYEQDMESFALYFQKVRESLALLAAVAHVDYEAWKYLLVKYSKVNFVKEEEDMLQDEVSVRFTLRLDWAKKSNQNHGEPLDYDLVQFCGVQQRTQPSAEYLGALNQITAMDSNLRSDRPGVDIKIPVRVHFTPNAEDDPMGKLQDVVSAEKTIQEQWREYAASAPLDDVELGSLRCTFVLEPMILDLNYFEISPELTDTMEQLMHDNVWFSKVFDLAVKKSMNNMPNESMEAFGKFMARLFDSTRRLPELASTKYLCGDDSVPAELSLPQLGSVGLKCDANTLDARDFEVLCSAITSNSTARNVSIKLRSNPATSATWWKWLAYAVFSARARSSSVLESLALTSLSSVTAADIAAFTAVLESDHPEEQLYGCPHGRVDEQNVSLSPGSPIRWQTNDRGEFFDTSDLSCRFVLHGLRTFSDDGVSEWMNVVVPGFGRCQVQRRDLIFRQSREESSTVGLMDLAIEFDPYQPSVSNGLPHLLKAVGFSLKVLTLSGPRMNLDENVILQSCPNLQELSLCGGLVDVQLNFTNYGTYHLAPLPNCHWHNVAALANDLSDPNSPLTKCVRCLRVRLTDEADGWGIASGGYVSSGAEADINPLLHMLDVNRSLEYFELIVRPYYNVYREDFKKHHLEPINRTAPLSMDMKVAFLSVMSALEKSWRMNRDVLENIFAFASPPVLRHVYFRKQRSGWGWLDER